MTTTHSVQAVYESSHVTLRILRALGWGPHLLNLGYFFFTGPFTFLNMIPSRTRLFAKQTTLVKRAAKVLNPQPGDRILDLACGRGHSSYYLAQTIPGIEVIGGDLLPTNIQIAQQLFANTPRLSYSVVDAMNTGLESDAFDRILCLEAAFHFPDKKKFLAEAYRLLKPGGTLCVVDFVWQEGCDKNRVDPEQAKVVQSTWGYDDFMPVAAYRREAASVGFTLKQERDWTNKVTKPLLRQFRWLSKLASTSAGIRLLSLSNEMLRTFSKRDWRDLTIAAKAHCDVHKFTRYGVFVWQKPTNKQ